MQTPLALYEQMLPKINTNAGYVCVVFLDSDERQREAVRTGQTGREAENGVLAANVTGALGVFSELRALTETAAKSFMGCWRYLHAEVVFELSDRGKREEGANNMLAVYVNGAENVNMRWRHFDARYRWRKLRATPHQLESMLKFACLTRGERFSRALTDNTVTSPGAETQPGWTCAKHVATMLRSLDCASFHMNTTNTLTIDELHALIDGCTHNLGENYGSRPPVVLETLFGTAAVEAAVYAQHGGSKNRKR